MSTVDERVDTLEYLVGQFVVQTNLALTKLSKEMREFKDEMAVFKDEMAAFKDEMKDETKGFQDGVTKFQDGMTKFKEETVIPMYASIVFPDEIIKYATKRGLYVMAYKEWEYVDILNFEEVSAHGVHNS